MKQLDMTVIILTKNEEANIERCINSVKGWVKRIIVVDSGSDDRTCEIAKDFDAEVYIHTPFENHGKQFNWAMDNLDIQSKWIFRLDADEVVTPELNKEIIDSCKEHELDDVNAFEMRFKVYFMDRFLKHGGAYPFCKINIFKKNTAYFCEKPLGDNVVLKEGRYLQLKNDCLHYDFKNLSTFIIKHVWYADLEVESYYENCANNNANISRMAKVRNSVRNNVYYKLPKYFRAKLYYWFNYYIRFGFLDGEAGRFYACIQAYFFRFIVDAKIYERTLHKHNYE